MNEILDVSLTLIIVLRRSMGLVDVLWVKIRLQIGTLPNHLLDYLVVKHFINGSSLG